MRRKASQPLVTQDSMPEAPQDSVSLCLPGCPGNHFVDQADLEHTETNLLLPPKGCLEKKTKTNYLFNELDKQKPSLTHSSYCAFKFILWALIFSLCLDGILGWFYHFGTILR